MLLSQIVIGYSPRIFLLSVILWAVLCAPMSAATILIDDFEEVSDWTNLAPESTTVQEGSGAGRWADTVSNISIRKEFASPLDLTSTTHVGFWLFSEVANDAGIIVIFDSENPGSEGWDYYSRKLTIDWTGWRWIWLSREVDFTTSRSPLGWDSIKSVGLYSSGWGLSQKPDTNLVLDQMLSKSSVVKSVNKNSAWVGPDYVYTYILNLEEANGIPTGFNISCIAPNRLNVSVNPAHVDLPENGSAVSTVTVTIPESVIQQGAYKAHNLLFTVMGNGQENWEDVIVNPPPDRTNPRTLLTEEDFTRISRWIETYSWAKGIGDGIISKADSWRSNYLSKYGLSSVSQFPEEGQWGPYYVCETHGVSLSYIPPMTHQCPVDNEEYTGWPYDQVIYARQHTDLSLAVKNTGLAYYLTGQESYAQDCRELLLLYANAYNNYRIHDIHDRVARSGGRVLSQTLDESVWLIKIAWGYDLIASSGVLTPQEDLAIQHDLLVSATDTIKRNDAGKSNWQAWHNAAIAMVGRAIDDPCLTAFAVNGDSGFYFHMANSVLSDGFWYESSWSYHFYTLTPMTYLAELGERGSFPLYQEEPLRKMYLSPIQFAPPDLVLPAFNDSGTVNLRSGYSSLIDAAYRAYGDPILALPLVGNTRREGSLFWGAETWPTTALSSSESFIFDGTGYAIMRGGSPKDPWYLALDYGEHGGWHGHFDKLGYAFYARGQMMGLDPGSHSYALPLHDTWDKSTPAHNTVAVDETDQSEATGTLERFVTLPGSTFAHTSTENAYSNVGLHRSIVMRDGYVLDVFDTQARDAQSHRVDWFYHNPGTPSNDLNASAYTGFPATGGYQHLENNNGETTSADRRFSFSFNWDSDYPGGLWRSQSGIQAQTIYSQEQAHEGEWSNKLHYDFSAESGYITFRTKSMVEYKDEVPTRVSVWVYGNNSGNRIRLRIVDATGENYVSPYTVLDFSGWKEISHEGPSSWTHWSGNNDGVIDLPLNYLALELDHEGGDLIGDLYADDWRLTFPTSGEVTVEDYEPMIAKERLWIKGQSGTTFVTGEGIGPDLLDPVPYVAIRRTGENVRFDVLHEPHGLSPLITEFQALACDAPLNDFAAGYQISTASLSDVLLLTGAGAAGTERSFSDWQTDGVLAAVRKNIQGDLQSLTLVQGSVLRDGSKDLISSPQQIEGLVLQFTGESGELLDVKGSLNNVRIYAPGMTSLTWKGSSILYERDGDYIVLEVPDPSMGEMWIYR